MIERLKALMYALPIVRILRQLRREKHETDDELHALKARAEENERRVQQLEAEYLARVRRIEDEYVVHRRGEDDEHIDQQRQAQDEYRDRRTDKGEPT